MGRHAAKPQQARCGRHRRLAVIVFVCARRCFVADAHSAPDWMVAVRPWACDRAWVHVQQHDVTNNTGSSVFKLSS